MLHFKYMYAQAQDYLLLYFGWVHQKMRILVKVISFFSNFYFIRRDLSFDPVAHSTPNYGNKKQVDLSDSGSEISDEGYKTSDNAKLIMADILNGSTPGGDFKHLQQQTRNKHNGFRSRPGSTDEGKLKTLTNSTEARLPCKILLNFDRPARLSIHRRGIHTAINMSAKTSKKQ